MRADTRIKFNAYLAAVCKLNGVASVGEKFAASEPVQQRINKAIYEDIAFLSRVQHLGIDTLKTEPISVRFPDMVGGRVDTSGEGERSGIAIENPDGVFVELSQHNYDVKITYKQLDTWRKLGIPARWAAALIHSIALTRLMVGFNGESVAATTDRVANPLGQDINIGWLKFLETHAAENFMTEVVEASGKIQLGDAGDFKNLNHLVHSVYSIIDQKYRSKDMVAIIGTDLVSYDVNLRFEKWGDRPTEQGQIMNLEKRYGNLNSIIVPGFPAKGLLVTELENLQHYTQNGSARRHIKETPEKDCVTDFNSMEEGYGLEEVKAASAIKAANVEILEA
jgi:P2 family phage major capsid protein